MFRSLADWIGSTSLSMAFQDALWVIPTSQSIHIIAIGMVFGSTFVLNLRLLGIRLNQRSISELTETLLPWLWSGLVVLVVTGIVQMIAEPGRQLKTPHFLVKMVLVMLVVGLTRLFQKQVQLNPAKWDVVNSSPTAGKRFAIVSLVLWVSIIILGRMIAYVWEQYE